MHSATYRNAIIIFSWLPSTTGLSHSWVVCCGGIVAADRALGAPSVADRRRRDRKGVERERAGVLLLFRRDAMICVSREGTGTCELRILGCEM